MIKQISIRKTATYEDTPALLGELSDINFIYGANGSGKTTISRIIKNPTTYPTCEIGWKTKHMEALVYNKDFVDENFSPATEIRGIFTLGTEDKNAIAEIDIRKIEIGKIETEVEKNKTLVAEKEIENSNNETSLHAKCWNSKSKYDSLFKDAFEGFRGSANAFKNKCVTEQNSTSEICELENLKKRASTIFGKAVTKAPSLPYFEYSKFTLLENSPILTTVIIGKNDVDISALISELDNSGWVGQGRAHLEKSGNKCPFCQQEITQKFKAQLDEYFDKTYLSKTAELIFLEEEYSREAESLSSTIKSIISLEHQYIDTPRLVDKLKSLQSLAVANILLIREKQKKPGMPISLEKADSTLSDITELLEDSGKKINDHNKLIDNFTSENSKLKSDIWKFITTELLSELKDYNRAKETLTKTIIGINSTITSKGERIKLLQSEIDTLSKRINSVTPTVKSINRTLNLFGFDGFMLEEGAIAGTYKIQRRTGECASISLSEGEKTFITLLYFLHLLSGSVDDRKITADRIVVFDDPISSLDSDVLFVVSNLIRRVIEGVRGKTGLVKQVIILTHNVYFHKEVSFDKHRGRDTRKDETFWIVSKQKSGSTLRQYSENPIKTSYQLLWQELKEKDNFRSITIHNTLRRILENYFKILGGMNDDDIIAKFDGEEQIICKSLLSWVNDGSHFVHDDLYVQSEIEATPKYLKVFEEIFIKTEHTPHYKMMMA